MDTLNMEIRSVDLEGRTLVGVVAAYDETTYLVPDPAGERIIRGAFAKSIRQRADRIPLHDNHGTAYRMGMSRSFDDSDAGLVGMFGVYDGDRGDRMLDDLRNGYYGGMSVGFQPLVATRGADGVREVREAKLVEVSVVGMPAYESAGILAVRNAATLDDLLAPFRNPPAVNLDPIPPCGPDMESIIDELADGGWIRVGPYSPYWKAPDDQGPSGRKWNEHSAHAEMIARRSVRKVSKSKSGTSSTGTKRGPGRPRKTPDPKSDD